MRIATRISIPDDDLGASLENRSYEIMNSLSRILIISISIDDDIGSEHEPVHDTMMKCCSQSSVRLEFYDMMDTECSCDFRRLVCTSIIDDEVFYLDARDMLR